MVWSGAGASIAIETLRVDQADVELPWPMNPPAARKLVVERRRRAGDERDGSVIDSNARCDLSYRLGNAAQDLRGLNHAKVVVGNEREAACALASAGVEDDRSGFRDGKRARSQRAVDHVERTEIERSLVWNELDACRRPCPREV